MKAGWLFVVGLVGAGQGECVAWLRVGCEEPERVEVGAVEVCGLYDVVDDV